MRFAVIFSVLLLGAQASAQELSLSAGTMQLGGRATFDIDSYTPPSAFGADSTTGFYINVRPQFDYFIIDRLAIGVAGGVAKGFGDLYEGGSTHYGVSAGLTYYIPLGTLDLHVGGDVGLSIEAPEEGDTSTTLNLLFPVGVLIPLNDWVAIDLGLSVNYNASLDEGGGSFLSVPIGYLGVQSFFGGGGSGGGSSSGDEW